MCIQCYLTVTWLVPCETADVLAHSVYTIQPCTMSCHFMQGHIHRVPVCLAVTFHLCFWQNDQDLLCTTAVIQQWNWKWYWKFTHCSITATFRSQAWHSNHLTILAPCFTPDIRCMRGTFFTFKMKRWMNVQSIRTKLTSFLLLLLCRWGLGGGGGGDIFTFSAFSGQPASSFVVFVFYIRSKWYHKCCKLSFIASKKLAQLKCLPCPTCWPHNN